MVNVCTLSNSSSTNAHAGRDRYKYGNTVCEMCVMCTRAHRSRYTATGVSSIYSKYDVSWNVY